MVVAGGVDGMVVNSVCIISYGQLLWKMFWITIRFPISGSIFPMQGVVEACYSSTRLDSPSFALN